MRSMVSRRRITRAEWLFELRWRFVLGPLFRALIRLRAWHVVAEGGRYWQDGAAVMDDLWGSLTDPRYAEALRSWRLFDRLRAK